MLFFFFIISFYFCASFHATEAVFSYGCSGAQSRKQQGSLALELVNLLLESVQMNPTSATLVVKLFGLAKKSNAVDAAYVANTLSHVEGKKGQWFSDLSSKLKTM